MASDLDQKREAIKQVYPKSTRWAEKVNKMSEEQVTAIYLRFRSEGKLR
jgi:hypothetical protein